MRPEAVYAQVALALIDPPEAALRERIDPERLGELADSMAAEGLHQPVGLRGPLAEGRYTIVWGHRRLLAAALLQWPEIAARVFPPAFDPALARVSENLQREDLTPVEEALAVRAFLERGHPVAAVARLFRRSPGWVHERQRVLELPEDLQEALRTRALPLSVCELLGRVDHDDYRRSLVAEAANTGASARAAAVWVAHYEADRDRIVQNHLTVQEIAQARQAYIVYYACDGCHLEVPYTDTESWRFCRRCGAELRAAVQAPASSA